MLSRRLLVLVYTFGAGFVAGLIMGDDRSPEASIPETLVLSLGWPVTIPAAVARDAIKHLKSS